MNTFQTDVKILIFTNTTDSSYEHEALTWDLIETNTTESLLVPSDPVFH